MKEFLTEWLLRYGMGYDTDSGWDAWGRDHSAELHDAEDAGYLKKEARTFRYKIATKGLDFLKEEK